MARKIVNTTTTQSTATTTAAAPAQPVRVDGYVVTRTLEVANPKVWGDEKVSLTVAIDFEGCDIKQILEWASRTKAIDLQRALRACELGYVRRLASNGVFKRKAVECGTGFADPAKAAAAVKAAVGAMTPEQRAELIKQLTAMM